MEPPATEENHDNEVDIKPEFKAGVVRSLSITLVVLGVLSIGGGIAILTISIPLMCKFEEEQYYYERYHSEDTPPPPKYYTRHCSYYATYSSPGIWGGLMFVASGIIGIFSAKRKTTCFIVAMMTVSIVTTWIAVCSMAMSTIAHFDRRYPQKNYYPTNLHVLDSAVTLLSLVCFILSWIKFGYACQAVCCNGKKKYPTMKRFHDRNQYQPLLSHPSYSNPQMQGFSGPQVVPGPQPVQAGNLADPIYLVQGHRVIGVLPQNLQQQQSATVSASKPDTAN